MRHRRMVMAVSAAIAVGLGAPAAPAAGVIDRFTPNQDTDTEVWRLTHEPAWRDWANYHIRNCWSPDGRYICTTHYLPYHHRTTNQSEVRVIDLQVGEIVRRFPNATTPRWAHDHNWLFFVQRPEESGEEPRGLWNIMWWDIERDRTVRLSGHSGYLGCTDCRDQWLYASAVTMPDGSSARGARVPIREGGRPEPLPLGGQLEGNPGHPKVYTRVRNYFEPFKPTRLFFDPDGSDISVASTCLQQCHQSWSGGGEWYLLGNSQMRGRRWDEPFPSKLHYLCTIWCGDICRCGNSDRWVCGSSAFGSIVVGDLRTGDGRVVLPWALSRLHDSGAFSYCYDSALHDNDAKGSPDGTKICFVTNYDLRDGPLTTISERSSEETGPGIHVESTDDFPERGRLSVRNEIIGYERKTATSFQGLTRGMYDTGYPHLQEADDERLRHLSEYPDDLRPGWVVTSFDARVIPEATRKGMEVPPRFDREDYPDRDTPLMWQRQTDVHVAVVRTPDRPWLRRRAGVVALIPGENHWETRGYRLLRDGERVTDAPLPPGATLQLPAGEYAATALEHAGLESERSNTVRLEEPASLRVLADAPDDFSWTQDRWLVGDEPVGSAAAMAASEALREVVHRYDGVIHREWYEDGERVRRHDLNADGEAIRRLFYEDGRLARREYYRPDGIHASTEHFDADGFITETVLYRNGREWEHWWYIKGTPVKLVTERGGHHTASPERGGTYVKRGIDWVKISDEGPAEQE
ncbi:MAG: hypothetical protein U9R79_10210 [Armatimonadota bacterium]|nr:hypothetical protein [Armatimonadota bacterium]